MAKDPQETFRKLKLADTVNFPPEPLKIDEIRLGEQCTAQRHGVRCILEEGHEGKHTDGYTARWLGD